MPINPAIALRERVAQYPTQKAAAAALKISPSLLTDILKHRRSFSDALLRRLGLTRRIIIERKGAK
jgi:plasmid maintenance system antidote protein VapI